MNIAALRLLALSLLLATGTSFGADVALSCSVPELAGWLLIACPLRFGHDIERVTDDAAKQPMLGDCRIIPSCAPPPPLTNVEHAVVSAVVSAPPC